jgi:hypothetical protein
MALDADEVTREVRKQMAQAARHEQLHERLSRVIGPVAGYENMTSPELAEYGLKKLGLEVPDSADDPIVVALEHALRGRSGREMGAGMDRTAERPSFLDAYLSS